MIKDNYIQMNGETYPEITTNSDENEKQNDISIDKKFKSQNELTDTQGMNELITNLVKNRDYLEKFLIFENKKNTAKKKINKNTFKNNQNDSYNGRKQIPKKKASNYNNNNNNYEISLDESEEKNNVDVEDDDEIQSEE